MEIFSTLGRQRPLQYVDFAPDRSQLLPVPVYLYAQSVFLVQLMCYGHLCQVVLLTPLLFGKSIALVVVSGCRHLVGTGVHRHSRHHLLLLLLMISVWVLLQLTTLCYTGTIATTTITADEGRIEPGNVRSHGTDRPEPVLKRYFQLTLDAGLGVEALGRILEGTSVNVDGRLGTLARLSQRQVDRRRTSAVGAWRQRASRCIKPTGSLS